MPAPVKQLIAELRTLLARASTETVAGYVASLQKSQDYDLLTEGLGLSSPMRELYYAMGLVLTTAEPDRDEFGSIQHQIAPLLERIQDAYLEPFLRPRKGGKYVESQVEFGAFVRTFFSGRFIGIPQLRHRIDLMLAPFDQVLLERWGFDSREALRVADAIQGLLQGIADRYNRLQTQRGSAILSQAGREALERKVSRERRAFVLWAADLPHDSTLEAVGGAFEAFLATFSVRRGDAGESFSYFDDSNPFEQRPIVILPGNRLSIPVINQLYFAILDRGIQEIVTSAAAQDYYSKRGVALEVQTLEQIGKLLPGATFYAPVYEKPGTDEHDILALFRDVAIVVECKSAPPGKAMRDPVKAFIRLRDQFKSQRGVEHAFFQSRALINRIRTAKEPIHLYDASRRRITVDPAGFDRFYSIIVTLDEFGILGTDLTMLLEKNADDRWPWVVSLPDLESFVEMFTEVRKWTAADFLDWLDERISRMGDFITDDELEIAGVFLKYGTLSVFPNNTKIFGLRDEAQIFDDLARAKFMGEEFALSDDPDPPDNLEVPQRLKDQIATRHRTAESKVVSRNEMCPCGSGEKYKRCHGKP